MAMLLGHLLEKNAIFSSVVFSAHPYGASLSPVKSEGSIGSDKQQQPMEKGRFYNG